MMTLLGTLVFILDMVAIVSLWGGNSTTERKVIWTLAILILPLLGMVLYFIFGRDRRDLAVPRV